MSKLVEEWRDIEGYEGYYQVSDWGRVKSVDRILLVHNPCVGKNTPTHYSGKLLKQHIGVKYGKKRCQTILSKNGKKKGPVTARLVYEAFIGNIPDGMQVNHIDEDPSNNCVWNLNLMTPKQNSNYGTRNKRLGETFKANGKLSTPIDKINLKTGEVLDSYPSAKEAARQTSFAQTNISRCCNGGYFDKRKNKWFNISKAYGFIWKKRLI